MSAQTSQSIYDFSVIDVDNQSVALNTYKDKVLLVVNTASQCGLTPQYQGLQALYDKYASQGLVVLGFPCNQFGQQEPGTNGQIKLFCETRFGVSFPLFAKIDVNGVNAHPLYKYLKQAASKTANVEEIEWNFAKFLLDRNGNVIQRYPSATRPEDLEKDIQALL